MKSPCKDCEFREVGCHGKSEYIAAQRVIKNFDGDMVAYMKHKDGRIARRFKYRKLY